MQFDSIAVPTTGFWVDTISFERLEHAVPVKVSSILWRSEGGRWSGAFTGGGLGCRCKTYSVFFDCGAFRRCRRTIGGVLETAVFAGGLKVDDKECLQDVL